MDLHRKNNKAPTLEYKKKLFFKSTVVFSSLGKLNVVKNCNCGLVLGSRQFFATSTAASKNEAR
jgi:hypothetical protein